jgi:hypothetical protein
VLAAQPLAVEQVGAGEFGAEQARRAPQRPGRRKDASVLIKAMLMELK